MYLLNISVVVFCVIWKVQSTALDDTGNEFNAAMVKELDNLRRSNERLEAKLNDVTTRLSSAETELKEIKGRLIQSELKNEKCKEKVTLDGHADDQLDQNDNVDNREQQRNVPHRKPRDTRQVSGGVAFSALLTNNQPNLGALHTIIFDHVTINLGNAYHSHTGIFIAPRHGAYVFHLATMENPGKAAYLDIVIDGIFQTSSYCDAIGTEGYETAGNMWIFEVNQGSEVWIRNRTPSEIHGNWFTTFSGFLLYEME